ncbi:hypothetical protein SAMN05877838_3578 [Hoeflea halophila]|uniref:YCII-related domain-containing protein n=1 Tax=Hoeflea halophila TaxID=714899 RepID=A0A286IET6_9HYPH|nr:hypothetical protein [Hoeflea halophila]SOE18643.1 hypothetical protein SAMN05877838_3578 [Hoeflea halophila]
MPKFVFAYHGAPEFETKQDGANHMLAWREWMQGLGDAVVDPGVPVGKSWTVSSAGAEEGGGSNPLSGITIVQADTMEAAVTMALACPHISAGGSIEVAEAMEMEM